MKDIDPFGYEKMLKQSNTEFKNATLKQTFPFLLINFYRNYKFLLSVAKKSASSWCVSVKKNKKINSLNKNQYISVTNAGYTKHVKEISRFLFNFKTLLTQVFHNKHCAIFSQTETFSFT